MSLTKLRNILRRRSARSKVCEPKRLAIEGIAPAPLTAEPDDAELAAAALMESLASEKFKILGCSCTKARCQGAEQNSKLKAATELPLKGAGGSYYHALAEKIKAAHEQERRAAMRFVAFAESELDNNSKFKILGCSCTKARCQGAEQNSKLAELERGLFKWQDAVEREQGDLLKRWQHCLADVTVAQMQKYQLSIRLNGTTQ